MSSGGVHNCRNCGRIIVGQFATTASGATYHTECFQCKKCHKPLSVSTKYYEVPEGSVCQECHTQYYTHKCAGCMQAIEGQATIALGSRYHPEHFKCQTCNVQLPSEQFYSAKGYFYCKAHAPNTAPEIRCAGCGQGIDQANFKKLSGNSYHPQCVKCANCNIQLGTNLFELKGKVWCNKCIQKAI